MKREEVLFYLSTRKVHIYLVNSKKEIIEELDTSTFFKYGEISDTLKFSEEINKIFTKNNILNGILKPNLYVLYNDVCNCDLEFLYREGLSFLSYATIKFIGITNLLKSFKEKERLVLYDKNYFTIIYDGKKLNKIESLDFDPIYIGYNEANNLHYSDKDLIWETFKSHFTNL